MTRILAACLALLAVGALGACQSQKADRSGQSTKGFYAPDYDTLWDVSRRQMAQAGFTPDRDASDKANKTMVSRWNTQLSPFSNRGIREQATLYFHPVEGRDGYWTVEANVIRQLNTNLKDPSVAIHADWDEGSRVPEKETRLVYGIQAFFLGADVSPQFRTDYGMRGAPPPVEPTTGTTPKAK